MRKKMLNLPVVLACIAAAGLFCADAMAQTPVKADGATVTFPIDGARRGARP